MAAPSIPNLLSLRGRGGLRGRGRGRARGQGSAPSDESPLEETQDSIARRKDQIVQQTDNDAASSRMSAVVLGYLKDPYASSFAPSPPPRRYPLINRGTYVRTTAIDHLVIAFLASTASLPQRQIISLGAGSDTRFFRLSTYPNLLYHELDFATNTASKISTIISTPALSRTLPVDHTFNTDKTSLHSATLNIHPLDLRTLTPSSPPPNISQTAPTLLLSECCLTYLSPSAGADIIRSVLGWLDSRTPAGMVLYEPICPNDAFGQTMVANLASRGIEMPSLLGLPSIEAQVGRLKDVGLGDGGGGWTVGEIYAGEGAMVGRQERQRVEGLEWVDEVEEWVLLASHYCVCWGWRGDIFGEPWHGTGGGLRPEPDGG